MAGKELIPNTDYTYTEGTLTIPKVTGALFIEGAGKTFHVTFNNEGETSVVPVEEGNVVSKPSQNPTKSGYNFLGWYDANNNKFDFTTPITEDITLYAIYAIDVYTYEGDYVFDGTNYINTGINLFNEVNVNRNFEVSFEIKQRATSTKQATLMSAMDETGTPWPGMVYRINNGNEDQFGANSNASTKMQENYTAKNINKVTIKRINGILYINFNDSGDEKVLDMTGLAKTFNSPVAFGASLKADGTPQRFFKGTLSNLSVAVIDTGSTIVFDANGGTGTAKNQVVFTNKNIKLNKNTYVRDDYEFMGWNTKKDGTGTAYADEAIIEDLSTQGEKLTLYAQWKKFGYTIEYNANGGTGTPIEAQTCNSGESYTLNANTFTKEGCEFISWNTKPDGSGKSYTDGETIRNIGENDGDVITLYAMWGNTYSYEDTVFDGTNYIDTGIKLYSAENINKNFEISFNIDEDNSTASQATLFSAINETRDPWEGFVFRLNSGLNNYEINANVDNVNKITKSLKKEQPKKITIKRTNNIIYISENDGAFINVLDMTELNVTHDFQLTIGASLDANKNPQRYFIGKLSDMKIVLYE